MRLLLDTHTFLWVAASSIQLSNYAHSLIQNTGNDLFFSVGSIWEMTIKISQGKLHVSQLPFDVFVNQQLNLNSVTLLDISVQHTAALINLPFHHRDPFDRLFIAQAIVEQMPIISKDKIFDSYNVTRLW